MAKGANRNTNEVKFIKPFTMLPLAHMALNSLHPSRGQCLVRRHGDILSREQNPAHRTQQPRG